jgi:hypothetical protein
VISGVATPEQYDAIWKSVLSQVGNGDTRGWIITPYYNYYVIRAMAEMGHRDAAVKWIREYWGGMVDEGATSFWEAYDPSWYHEDFHSSLQADNRSGYFVSLAHGWSAGPTAWLMEQVLGIEPTGAGFSTVDIRPDLVDLEWARGAEPTPHGLLKARVLVPVSGAGAQVLVNGSAASTTTAENGARGAVTLDRAGHYELTTR